MTHPIAVPVRTAGMTTYSHMRGKRGARCALLVVIVAVSSCSGSTAGGHATSPSSALGLPDLSQVSVDVTTPAATDAPREGTPAPSPREAVDRFVHDQLAGDTDSSYDLLAAVDRTAVRSRVAWRHAQSVLPRVRSFDATVNASPPASAATATVRGDARFEPRLDEINGLVPARASVTWTVVREEGGWRVAFSRTVIEPIYPADSGATESSRAWTDAYQACKEPPNEIVYAAGVVGVTGIGAALCGSTAAKLGAPARLGDRPNPAAVLAAFGPEADRWARVIPVSGPRSFNLVLAPFDDRWVVVGVLVDGP